METYSTNNLLGRRGLPRLLPLSQLPRRSPIPRPPTPPSPWPTPIGLPSPRLQESNTADKQRGHRSLSMELSDDLLNAYHRLLNEGTEDAFHIRLMVVGMYGVGKSSLVRRLCHESLTDVESTIGIEIYRKLCEVKDNGEWIIRPDWERERIFNARIQRCLERFIKLEPSLEPKSISDHTSGHFSTGVSHSKKARNIGDGQTDEEKDINNTYKNFSERLVQSQGKEMNIGNDLKQRILSLPNRLEERRPTLSLWDFAGQSVYYSTHHFFLNERSIYLLILDLSKNPDDIIREENVNKNLLLEYKTEYTCQEAFRFWIKSIYIYTKQKTPQASGHTAIDSPKILLIGTKKDEIGETQLNGRTYEKYKDDYFENILRPFLDTPVQELFHSTSFLVNNLGDDDGEFLRIKQEIFEIAKVMPSFKEQVPSRFIPLERALFQHQKTEHRVISLENLIEENKKAEFRCSLDEIKLFLAFQHAFGNIVYFNEELLDENIILKPHWLIDVFKAFVTHKPNKALVEMKLWNEFLDQGILRDVLVEKVLEYGGFSNSKQLIIQYMLYLDVIVRPVVFSFDIDAKHSLPNHFAKEQYANDSNITLHVIKEDFFIMPCMLPEVPAMASLNPLFRQEDSEEHTPTMCLYIRQEFLPPFVFHRMLATFLREYPINSMRHKNILYNRLGSFSITEDIYFSLWSWNETLHFRVSFPSNTVDVKSVCRRLRVRIEELIVRSFNFHRKGVFDNKHFTDLFDYRIKCHKCPDQVPFMENNELNYLNDYLQCLFSVADLQYLKTGKKKCRSCWNTVDIQEILEYWFEVDAEENGNQSRGNASESPKGSNEVDLALLIANKELLMNAPEESLLVEIATEIQSLNGLQIQLSIPDRRMEIIGTKWDRAKWPEEFKYHVLYEWMKRGECWNNLYTAMKRVGIDTAEFFRIVSGSEREDISNQTKKILNDLRLTEGQTLDDSLIGAVSECIGEEYWLLGIRLGIPQTKLERWSRDYSSCVVTLKILLAWHKLHNGIDHLIKALLKSNSNMSAVKRVLKERMPH